MQLSKWVSLFVFSTVLTTAPTFSHAAVLTAAAENTAIRVQESLTQRNQVFQAGPGIAVTETEAGRVQGFIKNGVYSYYGIPYAEAPRRFEAARPVTPWQGVRMVTQVGPISPQAQGNFPMANGVNRVVALRWTITA
jgi:para-nitrobenzyl esterase